MPSCKELRRQRAAQPNVSRFLGGFADPKNTSRKSPKDNFEKIELGDLCIHLIPVASPLE